MPLYVNAHVEVAGWSSSRSALPLSCCPQFFSRIDSRGDLHRDLFDLAFSLEGDELFRSLGRLLQGNGKISDHIPSLRGSSPPSGKIISEVRSPLSSGLLAGGPGIGGIPKPSPLAAATAKEDAEDVRGAKTEILQGIAYVESLKDVLLRVSLPESLGPEHLVCRLLLEKKQKSK